MLIDPDVTVLIIVKIVPIIDNVTLGRRTSDLAVMGSILSPRVISGT